MNENQQNPAPVHTLQAEPDDPTWYLQRMYDMTGDALEGQAQKSAQGKE